jgi:hypothetical protein
MGPHAATWAYCGGGVTLNLPTRLNVSKSAKHCDLDSISMDEYPAIWAVEVRFLICPYAPLWAGK